MRNWLITIANGPSDAMGRVATQYFTVYTDTYDSAIKIAETAVIRMNDYWEVREAEPLE